MNKIQIEEDNLSDSSNNLNWYIRSWDFLNNFSLYDDEYNVSFNCISEDYCYS